MKFLCRGHIRSGHQVESRDLTSKKVYARATATVLNRIFSSFSELNKATSTYNLYILVFWYIDDLGSGQDPDLSIMSQWGKYWNTSQRISKVQFFQDHVLLGHSWWLKVKCWPVTPLRSSEVTEVTNRFLQITWDWEELETWKWSQCVCLVNTLRLICNLGQAVTLTWGQILTLTFQGHDIHVSMRLDEANRMVSKLLLYHLKHRSYHWKTVSLKNAVFDLSWPLTLKRLILVEIWRHLGERAFQELSFAFLDLA